MFMLNTNWTTTYEPTKNTVERAKKLLDGRSKAVKESSDRDIDRVLTSFFAYGPNEYEIILDKAPEQDRALLSCCRDALTGEVLQRTKGRNGYKLKSEWYNIYQCRNSDTAKHKPVETTYRSTITDGSYNNVPLDQISGFNYARCGYIKVINPNLQTKYLLGVEEKPSLRFLGLEGSDCELVSEWLDILARCISDNRHSMIAHNRDTILCHDPEQAILGLKIAASRVTGKTGYNYSVEFKDIHGRQGTTWGGQV